MTDQTNDKALFRKARVFSSQNRRCILAPEMKYKTIIIFFLLSCCDKKSSFDKLLTENSKKEFWLQKKETKNKEWVYTGNQWIFYPDGTADCLVALNPDKKGTPVILNVEAPSIYHWNYQSQDSVLDIGLGVEYKIKKYGLDSILMTTRDGNRYILIHKHW